MFKKMFKVMMVSLLALTLVACSAGGKEEEKPAAQTYDLTLWGSQEDQELLKILVEDFKKTDEVNTYNITLGVVGEPDALKKVNEDPAAAADFVKAGTLYEVTKNVDAIKAANVEGSIDAVTLDDKMYGYPFTADNGYFMYYNSEFFSADDVLSLDKMLTKAEEAGKKIFFDLSNGWYIASFFLGGGGTMSIGADGKQIVDFNSEQGIKVGEYIRKFAASPAFITGDDTLLQAQAADGTIVAGVSGTWNADPMAEAFGKGYAATKLPTINIDGKETQLASFGGYKVYGVSTNTKHPEQAMALAEFLSNEASQIKRFEMRKLGPSNIKAAESDAVKADVALNALAMQSAFAKSQKDVLGSYWGPAEAFGTEMENKSTADMKTLLDTMVEQIQQ